MSQPEDLAATRQLADRLRHAREYLGLSQEEVAQHLAIPRPAVSEIERGRRSVRALELAKFARLYRRPMRYFVEEDPTVEVPQLEQLKLAAAELSNNDRNEVLRYAEFLTLHAEQRGARSR